MAERMNETHGEVLSSRGGKPKKAMPKAKKISKPYLRDESQEIVAGIGFRMRNLRKQQDLTLENLAERSKVSRAMISKVERSEKTPTLSILVRIAKGLNISLSSLLGGQPDRATISINRAKNRTMFRDPESGFEREMLFLAHGDSDLEIVLHRIPPGQSTGILPTYEIPTEKYVIVQQGDLVVHVDGQDYTLGTNDTMYFQVKTPYSFSNRGRKSCLYYVVRVATRVI